MQNLSLLFLAVACGALPGGADVEEPLQPEMTGCVIRVGQRMLLVKDVWSHRWSLPGGIPEPGETPRQAAEHGVFKQTGVRVLAGRMLGQAPRGFTAFECTPQGSLLMADEAVLNIPDAARRAISVARLFEPAALRPGQCRFVSQYESLSQWYAAATPVDATVLRRHKVARPAWFDAEMRANHLIQAVASSPADAVFALASGLGTLPFAAIVCLIVWCVLGWRQGAEVILLVGLATLLGATAKELCALPRPCYLDTSLCREAVSSFGFPSGHSVIAASLAGFLALHARGKTRYMLAIVPLACGVARLYWGSHFAHDVLGAWVLVGTLLVVYASYRRRSQRVGLSWPLWLTVYAFAGAVSLAVAVQPVIALVLSIAMGLGLALLSTGASNWPAADPRVHTPATYLPSVVVGVAAVVALTWAWNHNAPPEATFWASAGFLTGKHFCLGAVYPVLEVIRRRATAGAP